MAASSLSHRADPVLPSISAYDSAVTRKHHDSSTRLSRDERRKPKRIVIFCNGDIFFKGKKVSILPNRYLNYHDLLQDLTHRMPGNLYLPNGVRQLFSPSSGRRLNDVTDIRDGASYVCAGNETFKPVKYGVAELTPWGKGRASGAYDGYNPALTSQVRLNDANASSQLAGYNAFPPSRFLRHQKLRQSQQALGPTSTLSKYAALRGASNQTGTEPIKPPKVITVVKEGPRPRQIIKILLNRRGIQSFQQLMSDISESFGARARKDRIKNIYTIGGREVRDVPDFFRDEELFVSTSADTITLEQVSDLLEELYPKNPQTKALLKDWERRLKRLEKRNRLNPAKQQAGLHIEERDSGYDESDLTHHEDSGPSKPGLKSLKESPRQPELGSVSNRMDRVVGRQRADEIAQSEKRRHSIDKTRPLPLLHDSPKREDNKAFQERQKQFAEAEMNARLRAEAEQRSDEERKLKQEAKTKKTNKTHHSKSENKLPYVSSVHVQPQSSNESPRFHVQAESIPPENRKPILPPIPNNKSNEKPPSPVTEQQPASTAEVKASLDVPNDRLSPVTEEDDQETRIAKFLAQEKSKNLVVAPTNSKPPITEEETKTTTQASVTVTSTEQVSETPKTPKKRSSDKKSSSHSAKKRSIKDNKENQGFEKDKPQPVIRPISSTKFITDRYELGRTMGDGNFAIVRACRKKNSNNEYAIKIIDKAKLRGKEQMVINEVRIMKMCNHPNIVKLKEEFETKTEIYLVMELVKGGDLFDAISQAVKFNEIQAAPMVRDMADSLFYLHSRGIVHRDMKPENLLVYRKDGKLSLKLGDFGLAMEVDRLIYTVCGTPTYVAPEILQEQGYGLEVDLWAMGVITYILLCGFPPFRSRDRRQTELFDYIKAGTYEFLSPYWDHISNSAKDLIHHLLIVDRKKRFTAVDVLSHPWVITLGGATKLDASVSMAEVRIKRREQLEVEAKEAMAEFRQLQVAPAVT